MITIYCMCCLCLTTWTANFSSITNVFSVRWNSAVPSFKVVSAAVANAGLLVRSIHEIHLNFSSQLLFPKSAGH